MKMFRNGFWQKIVLFLVLLVQLAVIIDLCYSLFANAWDSKNAIWWMLLIWGLSFGLEVFLVSTDAENEYKIAWLVFIGSLPVIGSVFYLLFAHKIRTRKEKRRLSAYYFALRHDSTSEETQRRLAEFSPDAAAVASYIEQASNGAIYQNSRVEYFPLGDVAFPVMLRELEKAKHYIFLEYFIITPGQMWGSILEILKEKCKEGLDVRVVYDDVGNLGSTPVRYWDALRKFGIKAYAFSRIKPVLDIRMNNRDHRKILIVDGHTCFTGGINLADEYINLVSRFGHWKDNSIMIKGKAVYGFTMLFLANWVTSFEPKSKIDYDYYRPEQFIDEDDGFPVSDGFIQPYGDMPYSNEEVGEGAYLSILGKAKKYVYISTPYLVLDSKLLESLRIASLQGADVRIITPGVPDKKQVFQLTRANYGPLLRAGVKIFEYSPGFIHQKMFVCDDVMATDGTINLDYRSLYLHLECGTLIVGSRAIGLMKQDFIDTAKVSHQVSLEEWQGWQKKKSVYWALLKLVAPLL